MTPSAHLRTIPYLYACKYSGSRIKSQTCWNNSHLRFVIVLTDAGWPNTCIYWSWKLSGSYKLDVRTATRSKKWVSYQWNIGSMMHSKLRWFCTVILWLIAKEQVDWPKGSRSKLSKMCWVRWDYEHSHSMFVLRSRFWQKSSDLLIFFKEGVWAENFRVNLLSGVGCQYKLNGVKWNVLVAKSWNAVISTSTKLQW